MSDLDYRLAESAEDISKYIEDFLPDEGEPKYISLDTECTSLNTRISKLVGYSVSLKEGTAIYAPFLHKLGRNIPSDPAKSVLEDLDNKGFRFIFHNSKFDLNVIQSNWGWVPRFHIDCMELMYLHFSDRKQLGLKVVAKEDFKVEMTEFDDLFTLKERRAGIQDISNKSVSTCWEYACADADITYRIWKKYNFIERDFPFPIKVDTALIDIVRKMEHNGGFIINKDYLEEQIYNLGALSKTLKEQLTRMAGGEFEINSSAQVAHVLYDKFQIPTEGIPQTKKGYYSTAASVLNKLASNHSIVDLVLSCRQLQTRMALFKKIENLINLGIKPRFNLRIYGAPTFRFAAPGGDTKKDGTSGVNAQAVAKGVTKAMQGVDLSIQSSASIKKYDIDTDDVLVETSSPVSYLTEEDRVEDWDDVIEDLPYVLEKEGGGQVCVRETCDGCIANCAAEGVDTVRREVKGVILSAQVRGAFMVPDGYRLLSYDYDGQEIVIGANMSGERKWISAFRNGEDIHENTACDIFGTTKNQFRSLPEGEKKRKRDMAKMINFAIFYGANYRTIAQRLDVSDSAAQQIYDNFAKSYPHLFLWMDKVKAFARKKGYTQTWFGRKRWLSQYYGTNDKKMMAFADRSAVNTAIQGTGADVTRIAMVKVDKMFKERSWGMKKARCLMQIHDELAYMVHTSILEEAIPAIGREMAFKVKSWQVPLKVSAKVGVSWGIQKPLSESYVAELSS